MRIPLSWLKEYVDITLPVEELAERLTFAGLEVAAIETIGRPGSELPWDADKIVVGQIVEIKPHPNADRLVLAVVDYGASEPKTVVTGAPNLRVGDSGQKVAFALAGARLWDGYSDTPKVTTLKGTKIRGVYSDAMVCSEKELGLSDDHTGILILPDDAPVGTPLADYMGDVVLDLDLTPNLARCLSIIGVAREVAALTGQRLRLEPPTMQADGPPIAGQIALEIADPDLCNRYSATLIRGVNIGPSSFWMQRRLAMAGMRPINNIVDITNYVMLEWGQPLHAFDYDKLRQRDGVPTIIVRRAKPGERMTTLDGQERQFDEDVLLITDPGGPIAVAGVMGGLESEVTESTTNVLLESANFDNINNRRTAQALKLPSEASLRFTKGVPASLTIPAATRASELMRLYAGGTIAQGVADAYPVPQPTRVVEITPAEVERIVGVPFSADEIVRILESLEFACERDGETIRATVPDHRLDVDIPADLIEEIARVHGLEKLPLTLMRDDLPPQRRNLSLEGEERVRDVLVGCGLDEVITYALTNLDSAARLAPGGAEVNPADYIRLANPLSSERQVLRLTLMASLLETVRDNLRYLDRVAIFEVGRVYPVVEGQELPDEQRRLGVAMSGPRTGRAWVGSDLGLMDFFDLKGVVETLLARMGVEGVVYEPTSHATFHPGRVAAVRVGDVELGVMGEVHPVVREQFDLPERPVALAEFNLETLLAQVRDVRPMRPIYRFPAVSQDIAVIVDEDVPAQQVQDTIAKAGGKLLVGVELFDLYRGEQIPAGKKSLAYALTFQAPDRTLTDKEVSKVHNRIVRSLQRALGAELRG